MSDLFVDNIKHQSSQGSGTITIGASGETINVVGTLQNNGDPSYSAKAWVNFNGTGTVAIRGSGNVSSITDNGTGQYVVNFTTAMADTNYAVVGNSIAVYSTPAQQFQFGGIYAADNTTDFNVTGRLVDNDSLTFVASDIESVMVGVFR